MAVMMRFLRLDVDFRRQDRLALNFRRRNVPALKIQLAQFRLKFAQIDARVDERTEHHVATDSRKTVEVRKFHSNFASQYSNSAETIFTATSLRNLKN